MDSDELADHLFDEATGYRLRSFADVEPGPVLSSFDDSELTDQLSRTTVLLTGWGCPRIDSHVLAKAPNLRAIVHAAGTVKDHIDEVCWDRGILVSTAAEANAIPVAEFALAAILLAGKRAFAAERHYRRVRSEIDLIADYGEIGNYRRTVGVLGASRIGRRVITLLRPFDLDVLVCDPYLDANVAAGFGARKVELDELATLSDILSVHVPALPSTRKLIDERVLSLMPDGATLINTARGRIVDGPALERELVAGRLSAVLDVTDPEPLPPDSPLFDLDNVVLTPHLAGAAGGELFRLGSWAVDEIERYSRGEPFASPVTRDDLRFMA